MRFIFLLIGVCLLISSVLCGRDFYEILEIDRSATAKDIRRGYKKLALAKHPDKNVNDAKAHENFLEITRAYEALKDPDLRRKYDTYGEEALKDDQSRGGRYESWSYYNTEFGIYDEDKEIVTLSSMDFQEIVESSGDIWFIDFYSPRCSHCHDLAPVWRSIARELDGVIRIGAINCGEDWNLCRRQGVSGYPTLMMYPNKDEFSGKRTEKSLIEFAMRYVQSEIFELSDVSETNLRSSAWVITFCSMDGDCLSPNTRTKVSVILFGIAKIAYINCDKNEAMCMIYGIEHGTVFFKNGVQDRKDYLKIESLEAKEVSDIVLANAPDLRVVSDEFVQHLRKVKQNWLLVFTENESELDGQWRKLTPLLESNNIKTGRVNCATSQLCKELSIVKTPGFVIFKDNGGYEIFYGRLNPNDVSAWAKTASDSPLTVLNGPNFHDDIVHSDEPWLVDFFAPWCPPCMRLLPKLRQAASLLTEKNINVGIIDCSIHQKVCRDYSVRSYPTTILYNQSVPHEIEEHGSAESIVEGIDDLINPPVLQININSWHEVENRGSTIWLIDFYTNWCGPCMQFASEYRRLAKLLQKDGDFKIAKIDCEADKQLCINNDIGSYPTIRFFPPKSASFKFSDYSGWNRDAHSIRQWIYSQIPSRVLDLRSDNFEDTVLKSDEPWVIDFYAPWCGPCRQFAPNFELIGYKLEKLGIKSAKVDCESHRRICEKVRVTGYPSVFIWQGKTKQTLHDRIELHNLDVDVLVSEVTRLVNPNREVEDSTYHQHDEF